MLVLQSKKGVSGSADELEFRLVGVFSLALSLCDGMDFICHCTTIRNKNDNDSLHFPALMSI